MAQIILAKLWEKKSFEISTRSIQCAMFNFPMAFLDALIPQRKSLNDRFGNEVVMKTGGKFGFY